MTRTKAVAYARVSSKEQDEGFSIAAQQKLLHAYADQKHFQIVQDFVDVETAKKAGRTEFNAMVRFFKEHPDVRILLVEKTDRLYRNFRDWVAFDEFPDLELHLVKENNVISDTSRSSEKFMHAIRVVMAKQYIDNLSEEVRKGLGEKVDQGLWPSYAPIGYINVTRSDGRRIIDVDPVLGPVIASLFAWYAAGGVSIKGLALRAQAAGLVNRHTGGPVGTARVHYILRNRIYTGDFDWHGVQRRGSHQPLVSSELWERVQRMLDESNTGKLKHATRGFTFSGILTCGHCGCAMVGELKKGRYTYYHCTGGKGKCPEKYVREERLQEKLAEAMGRIGIADSVLEWVTTSLRASHTDQQKEHREAVDRLQAEYDRLEGRLHAMYTDKLDGRIDAAFFDRASRQWRTEQDKCAREIELHRKADRSYLDFGILILELAKDAKMLFEEESADEKRRLLKIVLSNCSWKHGELEPTFRQPFDLIAQMHGTLPPPGSAGAANFEEHSNWRRGRDSNPR